MKEMVKPGEEVCPFEFNFDEKTFKAGDLVSYRVTGSLSEMPFVGILLEVHDDYVVLAHDDGNRPPKSEPLRGTRENRPVVREEDAIG
ncbi:MAG: hypothetical protein MI976_29170 [Pseudomonadales bacterium]|nr:hypothetical protein [Pseudomonadales bacterium]